MKKQVIKVKRLKNTKHCWEPIIKVVPHLFSRYKLVNEEYKDGKLYKQYYEYELNEPLPSTNVEGHKIPSPSKELTDEQRARIEENRRKALEKKQQLSKSIPTTKTQYKSPTVLTSEQRARIEENRQKALKKRQLKQLLPVGNHHHYDFQNDVTPRPAKKSNLNESPWQLGEHSPSRTLSNCNDGWVLLPPTKKSPESTRFHLSVDPPPTSALAPRYYSTIAQYVQGCPNCMFMIRVGDCITQRTKGCWEHAVCPDTNFL